MKQILVMMVAVVLVGCGEFKEGFKKGFDRQKKAAEASKTPQQTKAKSEKLIADPIVKEAICKELKMPYGEFAPPVELTKADLEKVTRLALGFTQITDAGLKEVAKLQKLEMLILDETKITDEGLKEVAKLQKLERLILGYTIITDEGLKEVAKLQKLKYLSLSSTQITDAGLKEVAKLQNLKYLCLFDTKTTKASVAELRKALPNCHILGP